MYQYEIRFNNLKYQVFRRKFKKWHFEANGWFKWTGYKKIGELNTEKEAVEFINKLINKTNGKPI